jgi:hypothetical protein
MKGITTHHAGKFAKRSSGTLTARNQRRLERKGKHMKKVRWEGDTLLIPKEDHKNYFEVINSALEVMKNSSVPLDEGTIVVTPEGIKYKYTNGDWQIEETQDTD